MFANHSKIVNYSCRAKRTATIFLSDTDYNNLVNTITIRLSYRRTDVMVKKELKDLGRLFHASDNSNNQIGQFWIVPVEDVIKCCGFKDMSAEDMASTTTLSTVSKRVTAHEDVISISDFSYYIAPDDNSDINEHIIHAINQAIKENTDIILVENMDISAVQNNL